MSGKKPLQLLLIIILCPCISLSSQNIAGTGSSSGHVLDSLRSKGIIFEFGQKTPDIQMTVNQAVRFLQYRYQPQFWNNLSDPFRLAMGQLIFHATNLPFDSAKHVLERYPYDSLSIPWNKFYIWEPMRIKIPSTIFVPVQESKPIAVQKDTSIMVIIDTLHDVVSTYTGFPFHSFNYPYQSDSIKVAVQSLLKYLENRDSTTIYFTGIDRVVTPVWFNSKSGHMVRYWLKNGLNDSVTVWIGNTSTDTIGLFLEKEVSFKRPPKQSDYSGAKINVKEIDKSKLLEGQKIYIKPRYWKERMEANFILNQTALSNWIKGGENSIALSMDVTEFANYENKDLNLTSANFARIKLGFLGSGDNPIRKNLDLIETNSKVNHKAFGKFDFSAIMLFKTQLLSGYNYSGDNKVLVSKIFNPVVLTLGIGLDYKPTKTTSINFSPISYKGTFVSDTAHIDQTLYGIPHNRKSLHEPGLSLMVTNDYKPVKSVLITNRLQLFTNYTHNPQNIDVDWEMIATANLNWFTDVRLNTHLIYDDDAKTPVLDANKQPVLNPDGTPKKSPKAQLKEILGLSVVFRF